MDPIPASEAAMTERNRLSDSASPYLKQHADNPVHWMEWGAEAFELARQTDRPIFLSIGYAACHWCHVMAHESFEDEATAAVMNSGFVNVKVDREERPDVDQIYMNALHALGEQGGWPLSMFIDADGRPFWGGTYFPPEARYGRASFRDVLGAVRKTWDEDRSRIEHNASGLSEHLRRTSGPPAEGTFDAEAIDGLAEGILSLIDTERGGLNGAPKFPNAPIMETVWRAWLRTGDERYRDAFLRTVRAIAQGGIYDHVGGGLHRYSVDANWLVPHFEKMLYDQTHFLRHCLWAYGATGDDVLLDRIERTIAWLERDMRVDAGFAASLDADTQGEEGLTYTWTADEVRDPALIAAYELTVPHYEGRAIPNRTHTSDPSEMLPTDPDGRDDLLSRRAERPQPPRDDKVLTDWNAALSAVLHEVADVAGSARPAVEPQGACDLPHSRLRSDGNVRVQAPALLSDHAETMLALLAAWCRAPAPDLLERVQDHLHEVTEHYLVDGLPVLTHEKADNLLVRPSAFTDDPNPSPASQLSRALTILDALGEPTPDGLKDRLEAALAGHLVNARHGNAGAANALDMAAHVATLVMVDAPDGWARLAALAADPNLVTVRVTSLDALPAGHAARSLSVTDGPQAVLCRDRTCFLPATNEDALVRLLSR